MFENCKAFQVSSEWSEDVTLPSGGMPQEKGSRQTARHGRPGKGLSPLEKEKQFTRVYHDLDHLFGRWLEDEFDAIQGKIDGERHIDAELWQ